jgi:hypothetical protein
MHSEERHAKLAESGREIVKWCAEQNWLVPSDWEKKWKASEGYAYLESSPDLPLERSRTPLFYVFHTLQGFLMDVRSPHRTRKYHGELLDRLSDYLSLRGHDLDNVVRSAKEMRPSEPTRDFCLIPPRTIKWSRELEVESRLWHLLGMVLDHLQKRMVNPISCNYIESRLRWKPRGERSKKYVQNAVSDLNKHLLDIDFPWTLRTEKEYLIIERCTP